MFPSDRDAFAAVLGARPQILGIGEAHALRGTEGVEPAVRRFTRELLPLLAGRASDLVVELLLPNPRCERETKAAAREQEAITRNQAPTDQNDYVALANAARALGIRAHALLPTCEDLARIASAGPDAVMFSLDIVTRLIGETLTRLGDASAVAHDTRMLVAYGGAMHNDVEPRPGRAQWSFGPAMQARTNGRYIELDLIVREFIQGSPAWRSLPWVTAFDPTQHVAETLLLSPAETSFVLVFPGRAGIGGIPVAPAR
jgi:hypothetical protein